MGFFSSFTKEVLDDALGIEPKHVQKVQSKIYDDILGLDPPKPPPPARPLGVLISQKPATDTEQQQPVEPVGNEGVTMLDSWAWTQRLLAARRQQHAASQAHLQSQEQARAAAQAQAEAEQLKKDEYTLIAIIGVILLMVIL